jgi:myo-inositol catabolism protein IolC
MHCLNNREWRNGIAFVVLSWAAECVLLVNRFSKALVRYNPQGDAALNDRQSKRLRQLSVYLRNKSKSLFMFELLVPPEKSQLELVHGDRHAYDSQIRPRLTADAIKQVQDAGVEPDVWKVEGLDRNVIYTREHLVDMPEITKWHWTDDFSDPLAPPPIATTVQTFTNA